MFIANAAHTDLLLRTLILGPLALAWVLLVVRLIGLRSFSKMIAIDFVVTIASGSLLANAATATDWPGFLQASGSILALLAAQAAFTAMRRRWTAVKALENEPTLLMTEGQFCRDAMAANRISEDDIRGKLREANVLGLDEVRAVVLETTGDISVLHGPRLNKALLENVNG